MRWLRVGRGKWAGLVRLIGLLIIGGAVSTVALAQVEPAAQVVAVSGTAYACPRTTGCATALSKGVQVYANGEVRTGAGATADLQSRTTVFRLQGNATLQLQDITNAFQRLLLKAGRIFIAHDPQGRDIITVAAGTKRVEATDTLFTVVVTETADLSDADVYVAVSAGGGSVQVTLASGATIQLLHGQEITIPAAAQTLPPAGPIRPAEQAGLDNVVAIWRQTPGLTLPTSPEFVPQTGYRVADKFLPYWEANDGPRLLGYPVSEEFYAPSILDRGASGGLQIRQATSPQLYASQCFERALMEFHPENAGSPYIVEGAQLGRFSYRERYGATGAGGQVPNQAPGESQYFPETGHWVGGRFWHYWQEHGGLSQFGYPISDEFTETSLLDGSTYTVQYFERAVFEYHPEFAGSDFEVSLSQLGTYYCRGGALPTFTPTATPPPTETPTRTSTPIPTATETATQVPTNAPRPRPTRPATLSPTPVPPSLTPTPTPPCGWVVAATGLQGSILWTVRALAANDIWAGGVDNSNATLLVHWNGTTWSRVPSPTNGSNYTEIRWLAASASNDVWAVGASYTGGPRVPYILHWDGGTWSVIPSGAPADSILTAVTVVAANDAWAVGQTGASALALHWNGVNWSQIATPGLSNGGILYGVTALAANNVWAVGQEYSAIIGRTLVEHWDGVSWSVMPSPNTPDPNDVDTLWGVAARSANDIWAVGDYKEAVSGTFKTLIEHWNGVSWTLVPSPNVPARIENRLFDVAVIGANDVWAVGLAYDGTQYETLAQHWDGAQWTINPTANLGTGARFEAVTALGANDVWAVGGSGVGAFIEHYLGPCAPSPTPTP